MSVYNERDFHEDDFLYAHESGKKLLTNLIRQHHI